MKFDNAKIVIFFKLTNLEYYIPYRICCKVNVWRIFSFVLLLKNIFKKLTRFFIRFFYFLILLIIILHLVIVSSLKGQNLPTEPLHNFCNITSLYYATKLLIFFSLFFIWPFAIVNITIKLKSSIISIFFWPLIKWSLNI